MNTDKKLPQATIASEVVTTEDTESAERSKAEVEKETGETSETLKTLLDKNAERIRGQKCNAIVTDEKA